MNKLIVEEFEQPSEPQVTVILDTHIGRMPLGARHLENGLSFITTLLLQCVHANRPMNVCAWAPEPLVVSLDRSRHAMDRCLSALAQLKPNNKTTLNQLADHIPQTFLNEGDVLVLLLGGRRNSFDETRFRGIRSRFQVVDLGSDTFQQAFTRFPQYQDPWDALTQIEAELGPVQQETVRTV